MAKLEASHSLRDRHKIIQPYYVFGLLSVEDDREKSVLCHVGSYMNGLRLPSRCSSDTQVDRT